MIKLKKYFIRLAVINLFSLIYLIDTISFDYGFFSIQSIFYCLNIYLTYFFIFFEAILSLLGYYGLDINFLTLVVNDVDSLNFKFIKHISYQNINFIYFFIFSFAILYFLEKKKYNTNLIKKYLSSKKIIFFTIFLSFIISNINPNLTHNSLLFRYKHLTDNWNSTDLFFKDNKYNTHIKNNFFRNDNWYKLLKYSITYADTLPAGPGALRNDSSVNLISKLETEFIPHNNFNNFGKVIQEKKYNNIFVIINESYPNFRNEYLKKNLFNQIISGNENLVIKIFKRRWNRTLTTQGAEMDFFCNNAVDVQNFLKKDLKTYVSENNCWIKNFNDKNLIYIHSYTEKYFNRIRYKSFFDETFFKEDLELLNFKICEQNFPGICDHEIIDNLQKITKSQNNNLLIFLTVNNHIPVEPVSEEVFIDCKKNYPLNLNDQYCTLYNNQMLFNKSVSKFLSKMGNEDLLIFFSDTPPMFNRKHRIHFQDIIDIYFFSKN